MYTSMRGVVMHGDSGSVQLNYSLSVHIVRLCGTMIVHNCRLLQSLILEPQSSEVVHQALEAVPMHLLQKLSSDINTEVCTCTMG